MLRKLHLYAKACALRKQGLSYSEILKRVPVAQSTVSRWCHSIVLTPQQKDRLNQLRANNSWILGMIAQKTREEKEAMEWAEQVIRSSSFNMPLATAGVMLHLAEGAKTKTYFEIFNSDPLVIQVSIQFLEKILGVSKDQMRITLRLYPGIKKEEAEAFWSSELGVPLTQFSKPEVITRTKTVRKKRLQFGMCRLRVHRREVFRKTIALSKFLLPIFKNAPVVQLDRTSRS